MSSVLRNFIRTKKNKKRDRHIRELRTIQEHLQKDLSFWETKFTEEKELIELLQNHISSLSDEVEDAKDALFSEIEHQSFSMECEMILKIQTQVKIGKRKCKQLSKRIEECEMQQSIMRKQLNEMNSRIEENEKYKIGLLQRKAEAERITVCWRNRAAPLQLSDSCSVSSPLNVHHQSNV